MLVFSFAYPPSLGGGATRTHNLLKQIIKRNEKVTIISSWNKNPLYNNRIFPYKKEQEKNIDIYRIWTPMYASKSIFSRLIMFLCFSIISLFLINKIINVDIIFCSNPNIFSMLPGKIFSFKHNSPIIQNIDDLWPEELVNLGLLKNKIFIYLLKKIVKIIYNLSDHIIVISPSYKKILINNYMINKNKITFIPSGVDISIFNKIQNLSKNDIFSILYIGSFSIAYDFECIINAANLLRDNENYQFVIQGYGDLYDDINQLILNTRCKNVTLIRKFVTRKELPKVLSRYDVFILPLAIENYSGISTKIYEYMAAGRPIICCSGGVLKRLIEKINCGIVVPVGNYHHLANAIKKLHDSPNLSLKMGKNGRNFVEKKASIDVISDLFFNILNAHIK